MVMNSIEEIIRQMEKVLFGGILYVPSDNAFTSKARYLQCIRRKESGANAGFRMVKGRKVYYANLAVDGKERNRNFLSDEIFNYAKQRVADIKPYETIEDERLFCNFLSSQPMAFNLFYPLMKMVEGNDEYQKKLANVVKAFLTGDVVEKIDRITAVGIEFIPDYWKNCLHDKTAMDAYFRFSTFDGKKGIIAIETKYTDKLGNNEAKNIQPALDAVQGMSDIFTLEGMNAINNRQVKITQVFRNFLLTEKVRQIECLDDSISIVLAPSENTSNKSDEKVFLEQLSPEHKYKFQSVALEDFVMALKFEFPDEQIFEEFYKRYLEFGLVDLYKRRN